jgi:hypothetical protein
MEVRTRIFRFEIDLPEVIDQISPEIPSTVEKMIENSGIKKTVLALPRLKCPYCFHEWIPRTPEPKRCPRCQNVIWRLLFTGIKIEVGKNETP